MSPGRRCKRIRVKVPRHNTPYVSPKLAVHVKEVASSLRIRVDPAKPGSDASIGLAQAIDSASEWNSMLMTARAERGPQWDVGTQMFHVDYGSELYYDPSPLESQLVRDSEPPEKRPPSTSHPALLPPGLDPRYLNDRRYASPARSQQGNPYPSPGAGSPFPHGQIPLGQFYADPGGRMGGQMGSQIGPQVGSQIGPQMVGQMVGQMGDQIGGQMRGQMGGQIGPQMVGQMGGQIGPQMVGQMGGQIGPQMGGQMGGQMGQMGQMGGQMGGQMMMQHPEAMSGMSPVGRRVTRGMAMMEPTGYGVMQ